MILQHPNNMRTVYIALVLFVMQLTNSHAIPNDYPTWYVLQVEDIPQDMHDTDYVHRMRQMLDNWDQSCLGERITPEIRISVVFEWVCTMLHHFSTSPFRYGTVVGVVLWLVWWYRYHLVCENTTGCTTRTMPTLSLYPPHPLSIAPITSRTSCHDFFLIGTATSMCSCWTPTHWPMSRHGKTHQRLPNHSCTLCSKTRHICSKVLVLVGGWKCCNVCGVCPVYCCSICCFIHMVSRRSYITCWSIPYAAHIVHHQLFHCNIHPLRRYMALSAP